MKSYIKVRAHRRGRTYVRRYYRKKPRHSVREYLKYLKEEKGIDIKGTPKEKKQLIHFFKRRPEEIKQLESHEEDYGGGYADLDKKYPKRIKTRIIMGDKGAVFPPGLIELPKEAFITKYKIAGEPFSAERIFLHEIGHIKDIKSRLLVKSDLDKEMTKITEERYGRTKKDKMGIISVTPREFQDIYRQTAQEIPAVKYESKIPERKIKVPEEQISKAFRETFK